MRRKFKCFLTSFLAALFMATLIVPIAACDTNGGGGNTTVSVVSMGNKGLEGVTVTAKSGSTSKSGKTNENGKVSLNLDKSLAYDVTFENLPKGYYISSGTKYKIEANSKEEPKFYIPSKVIEGESVDPKYVYKTGDVMYDFSFTTTVGGKTVTLSEELETKKAVIINFWGSLCSNCQVEFPAIESTYKMFEDKLSVMAIVPPQAYGDTDAKIVSILGQWKLNLSFYYGLDSAGIYKNIYAKAQNGAFALPVSAIIDRYGVVCEIIVGGESDASVWQETVAHYVSDNYVPDIKIDQDSEEIENFEPDKPADCDAHMSDSADINKAINKTGTNILFTADNGEYSWPWALSSDGKSIVPLGSKHGLSYSIIYADINIPEGKALLVDYKVSSQEDYDLFEIAVDNNDLGRVTFTDSGDKDWQTALAYVPLTPGNHQIAFVYYKGTIKGKFEDTVYLNNLRFVDIDSKDVPSSDVSYYAARDYEARTSTYNTYEEVYFADPKTGGDGYYHIKGRPNSYEIEVGDGKKQTVEKDPYLLFDMTHMIPYTRGRSFYERFLNDNETVYGGKNYYNELMSYAYVAGNSAVEGAVPVTKELHDILVALCKHVEGTDVYEANPDMWLEFCIFYMHYGSGEPIDDPIKGLAYFSAQEAKLTNVYDNETSMNQVNAILKAQEEKAAAIKKNPNADTSAWDKIIADTTKAYEDNLATYNSVVFDDLIVPRGKLVKFTATEAGVYHFYSVGREDNPDYICEAQLFDSSLNIHTALARPIATHDSDTLFRDGSPAQFHLYHYLEEGESCYLNLMFYSSETLDTMYYAVNKIHDTEYKMLKTVTAGFLTTSLDHDTLGKLYRPLYIKGFELKADNHYYETSFGNRFYVDFTGMTRFSTSHTLEHIIRAKEGDKKFPPVKIGNVTVNFDLTGVRVELGKQGEADYEVIEGKDYTAEMQAYLDGATANPNDPNYGLVEANKELRDILMLFIAKYDEVILADDWLMFCYFYEYFGANY